MESFWRGLKMAVKERWWTLIFQLNRLWLAIAHLIRHRLYYWRLAKIQGRRLVALFLSLPRRLTNVPGRLKSAGPEPLPHSSIIQAQGLTKTFLVGKQPYEALRGVSLTVKPGDFVMIYGPSGAGKSTLLNLLIGLEQPTTGSLMIEGTYVEKASEEIRSTIRARIFGVVQQQPIWVKSLSVLDNIALPPLIAGKTNQTAYRQAKLALAEVGLSQYWRHRPTELSGGQQSRISLARALVHNPSVLVLDEPTGNLDTHTADEMMQLLQHLNTVRQRTIIMVTHNLIYLPYANRTVAIEDGVVREERLRSQRAPEVTLAGT